MIEPASTVFADIHIAHSLRDVVQLAEMAGIGVCLDVFTCWTEAGLEQTIERAMPRCQLIQVSDYVLGDRASPCRAVPGDGAIPLERILGWALDAGYAGAFDLELLGPRIDGEGRAAACRRSAEWIDWVSGQAGRLGAGIGSCAERPLSRFATAPPQAVEHLRLRSSTVKRGRWLAKRDGGGVERRPQTGEL